MFGKVFKYDLKFVLRIWWICAAISILISIIGGFLCQGLIESIYTLDGTDYTNQSRGMWVLTAFLSFFGIYGIILILCLFPTSIIIISLYRYYKSFFSDEGYLTFTLPVKRSTLLNSKILMNVTIQSMSLFVLAFDFILLLVIGCFKLSSLVPIELEQIPVADFLQAFQRADIIVTLIMIPLTAIASLFMSTNLSYLCITIGCIITRRFKILAAIGIYLAASAIVSTFQQTVQFLTTSVSVSISSTTGLSQDWTLFLFYATTLLVMIAIAVGSYFLNLYFLKKKLNLS